MWSCHATTVHSGESRATVREIFVPYSCLYSAAGEGGGGEVLMSCKAVVVWP